MPALEHGEVAGAEVLIVQNPDFSNPAADPANIHVSC